MATGQAHKQGYADPYRWDFKRSGPNGKKYASIIKLWNVENGTLSNHRKAAHRSLKGADLRRELDRIDVAQKALAESTLQKISRRKAKLAE